MASCHGIRKLQLEVWHAYRITGPGRFAKQKLWPLRVPEHIEDGVGHLVVGEQTFPQHVHGFGDRGTGLLLGLQLGFEKPPEEVFSRT